MINSSVVQAVQVRLAWARHSGQTHGTNPCVHSTSTPSISVMGETATTQPGNLGCHTLDLLLLSRLVLPACSLPAHPHGQEAETPAGRRPTPPPQPRPPRARPFRPPGECALAAAGRERSERERSERRERCRCSERSKCSRRREEHTEPEHEHDREHTERSERQHSKRTQRSRRIQHHSEHSPQTKGQGQGRGARRDCARRGGGDAQVDGA